MLRRNLRVLPGVMRPTRSEALSSWDTLGCQSGKFRALQGLLLEDTQLQRNSACFMGSKSSAALGMLRPRVQGAATF